MLSAEAFALGHLVIVVGSLIALVIMDRRSRESYHRWHRDVRYRHISTAEVIKMIDKARRPSRSDRRPSDLPTRTDSPT